MERTASGMRTLTFGDRSISYNEANDDLGDSVSEQSEHDNDYSYPSSIYPCSDLDSGVGDEREERDVCCEEQKENVETDRKVIKPDLKAIEELTNFEEDDDDSDEHIESEDEESENLSFEDDDTDIDEEADVFTANVVFDTKEMLSRRHEEEDDMCLNGFEYHSLGPASLSVLQLNRSELVHMRHVMVKIELDSRLQGGQREVDTMMARLEGGRVCVVCTRTRFSYFSPGVPCSVCQFSICKLCTAAPSLAYQGTVQSLPASPTPPSPTSPSSPSSPPSPAASISTRLGTLFRRRSSVSGVTRPRSGVTCRPCSQFVQQMDLMSEEEGGMADRTERIM